MSDIQREIANDVLVEYFAGTSQDMLDLWEQASDVAQRLVETNPPAGIAAVLAVLLDQWATTPAMRELADQAYNYAVARTDCHEYDVGQAEVPDTIEGLDE